jgi:hypothetical protein
MDVREGGALRFAEEGAARARALREDCVAWFPGFVQPLMPLIDKAAKRWLERSASPYVEEIRKIATTLGFPGIWFLNGSYQWSCTARAFEQGSEPWLARTLDWPFPGLGRNLSVARMLGPAGEFYNVAWPGYVGALTAMAPGRFSASINQAPMRRRTHSPLLRLADLAINSVRTFVSVRAIPPDQLLRQVFETCRTYDEARRVLETTPIARPVIYTLAGCRPGEECVIERLENGANTRTHDTVAANDWFKSTPGWEGRISASQMLTCSYRQAAEKSVARRTGLASWQGSFARDSFRFNFANLRRRCRQFVAGGDFVSDHAQHTARRAHLRGKARVRVEHRLDDPFKWLLRRLTGPR